MVKTTVLYHAVRLFIKYWVPVLLWMLVIFSASADRQSGPHANHLIEPFIRWLKPDLSKESISAVILAFRKAAHLSEYAVLGMLLYRARVRGTSRIWCRSAALFALALAAVYAGTDEFHQAFVPNREAAVTDVLIDAFGASIGLGLIWVWLQFRRSNTANLPSSRETKT